MEFAGQVATGLGFGAEKHHKFIKKNMEIYENLKFDAQHIVTCVEITTSLLKKYGLTSKNIIQDVAGLTIYPTEYFCPYNMETRKTLITDNTYSIHHYDATWYGNSVVAKLNKKILPFKIKLRRVVNIFFGDEAYKKLKNLFIK